MPTPTIAVAQPTAAAAAAPSAGTAAPRDSPIDLMSVATVDLPPTKSSIPNNSSSAFQPISSSGTHAAADSLKRRLDDVHIKPDSLSTVNADAALSSSAAATAAAIKKQRVSPSLGKAAWDTTAFLRVAGPSDCRHYLEGVQQQDRQSRRKSEGDATSSASLERKQ